MANLDETRAAPACDYDDSESRTTTSRSFQIYVKHDKSKGTWKLTHTLTSKTRNGKSPKCISSCGYIDKMAAVNEMPLFQRAIAKDNAKYWISPGKRITPGQMIEKYGTVEDLEVESEPANKKSRTSPPPPPPPPVEESKSDNTKKRGRPPPTQ